MVRSNVVRTWPFGYFSNRDPDELIAHFTEAIQADSHNARAYYGRGIAYMKKARYQRPRDLNNAIADFNHAIQLGLDDPDVYLRRGVTYQANGDLDRAIGDFAQAIGIAPKEFHTYLVQPRDSERKGKIDKAGSERVRAKRLTESAATSPLQKPREGESAGASVSSGDSQRLAAILSLFKGEKSELIPILLSVQAEFGCVNDETMHSIARFTGVPESRVYAVATFYSHFHFAPVGTTNVVVCRGVSCYLRGGPRILRVVERELGINEGETTKDGHYSLETIGCTGNCARAPCIMINDKVESRMTPRKVMTLFQKGVES